MTTLLHNEGVTVPKTFTVESRSNRRHFYFRQTPATLESKNLSLMGLFELRCRDQYVVGAGSIHPKTGLPYQVVEDVEIVPFPDKLLKALQWLKGESSLKVDRIKVKLADGQKVSQGERHYALRDFCARQTADVAVWEDDSLQELFTRAWEFNLNHCEPPHTERHVAELVNWFEGKKPADKGIAISMKIWKNLPGPKVETKKSKFLLPRKDDNPNFGHWWPRRTTSLCAAPSGTGKTVLLAHICENLRLGQSVLGHTPVNLEYRFLMVDRTLEELEESLDGKGLDAAEVLKRAKEIDLLDSKTPPAEHITAAQQAWEREGCMPDLLVLEGADLWCPEATGMKETKQFLKTVAVVAQKWDIAILATVGAPKQKGSKKDRYTLTRDRVFGSVAWGRLTSTLLDISLTVEEDPDSIRLIQVLPRTGRRERFYFEFEDGRLVYRDGPKAEPPTVKPDGVEETERLKMGGKHGQFITYLETQPVGTVISPAELPYFGSPAAIRRMLAELAHPVTGWVTKRAGIGRASPRWEVTHQNRDSNHDLKADSK